LNALYFMPLLLLNKNRTNMQIVAQGKMFPSIAELTSMAVTFGLTVLAWIFFRAESVSQAVRYIGKIFSPSLFKIPDEKAFLGSDTHPAIAVLLIIVFVITEWIGREHQYALARIGLKWQKQVRWAMYYILVVAIFLFMGKEQQFIYFQF